MRRGTFWRRPVVIALAAFLVIGLGGCYVVSVNPIAEAKDCQFDSILLGAWVSGQDTIIISGQDIDNLEFGIIERSNDREDSVRRGVLSLMLTRIGESNYMAVKPSNLKKQHMPTLEQMCLLPVYAFMRYRTARDTLVFEFPSYDQLDTLLQTGKLRGLSAKQIDKDGPLLITSSTTELRTFLAAHERDSTFFGEPAVYVRAH
jgi:hypothetical protein